MGKAYKPVLEAGKVGEVGVQDEKCDPGRKKGVGPKS